MSVGAWLGALARAARSAAASTAPWPAGRALRALAAVAVAGGLALWTAAGGHPLGGLLSFFAVCGLLVLAVALVDGGSGPLGAALVLLGAPSAVVASGTTAAGAAGAGAALVAVLELSRWSLERRVAVAGTAREWRRGLHLAGVLGGGWLAGAAVVGLASGRIALGAWQAPLGALAAVAVAAAVAAAATRG